MGRTVRLTGHMDVPPDRLDAVRAALCVHVRLTRAEPGCLRLDIVELPDPVGRFAVSEAFTGAAAFEAHQARAAASRWAKVTAGIARSYTITGLSE